MRNTATTANRATFHPLKVAKKEMLTKNIFTLELAVPENLREKFQFKSGQYLTLKIKSRYGFIFRDFSMTSAPYEGKISLGIKINSEESAAAELFRSYQIGDLIDASEPAGRFTLASKPHEFRTIIGFAAGIGITPILSHFKNILHSEPRTRLFLFYGNRNSEDIAYREELDHLAKIHGDRLQIHYFLSKEKPVDNLFFGRLDKHKLKLIINQILHLDDTDEESTIWDSVDEVLICGKGEMIREIANACYEEGIPKKNIHFELFEEFNEDIFPQPKDFPLVSNISVNFKISRKNFSAILPDNGERLLQGLLIQQFPVPYSCKSGICGSCVCRLEEGEVELLENEYLTKKEEEEGKILACMSVILSKKIKVDFDFL